MAGGNRLPLKARYEIINQEFSVPDLTQADVLAILAKDAGQRSLAEALLLENIRNLHYLSLGDALPEMIDQLIGQEPDGTGM